MPGNDDDFGTLNRPPKRPRPVVSAPAIPAPPVKPVSKVESPAVKRPPASIKTEPPPSLGPRSKVTSKSAQEISKKCSLSEAARQLLEKDMTTRKYLDTLIEKKLFPDATQFLAHALPKREAVWWSCLCARQAYGASLPAVTTKALESAENWVTDPSEENRRAAESLATAADVGTPAGAVAASVFWSGGSLGPASYPPTPPGEYLTARGVAGAVLLSAVWPGSDEIPERFQRFLELGIQVANGVNHWKPVKT